MKKPSAAEFLKMLWESLAAPGILMAENYLAQQLHDEGE